MAGTDKSPTLANEEPALPTAARLVVYPSGGAGSVLRLDEVETATFGRWDEDAVGVDVGPTASPTRLMLGRDKTMSEAHCRLRWDPLRRRVRVVDLNSRNGTRVMGRRVHGTWLADQDVVRVGNTFLVVEVHASACQAAFDRSLVMSFLEATLGRAVEDPATRAIVVFGEPGTGKSELARRAIEGSGIRPFVRCRCAELSDGEAQARLFGGGGALAEDCALAEANGGWCLLDDLDQLPLRSQRTLLRLLDDGTVGPWGSGCAFSLRFVATTRFGPRRALSRKQLVEGLVERLDPVVVELPPLRARRADILTALRDRIRAAMPQAELADLDHRSFDSNALEALLTSRLRHNLRVLARLADRLDRGAGRVEWHHLPTSMRRSLRRREGKGVSPQQAHYTGPPNDMLEDLWYELGGDRKELGLRLTPDFPQAKSRANIGHWLKRIGLLDKHLPELSV